MHSENKNFRGSFGEAFLFGRLTRLSFDLLTNFSGHELKPESWKPLCSKAFKNSLFPDQFGTNYQMEIWTK